MIRLKACVLCVSVALAGAAYVLASRQQMDLFAAKNYVLSADSAYVVLQPEPVAGSRSDSLLWSSDGSYLLVARTITGEESVLRGAVAGHPTPAARERNLVVYRMLDRRSSVLWRANTAAARLDSADWFPGSNRIAVTVTEPMRTEDPTKPPHSRQSILIFDADKGTSTTALSIIQEGGSPSLMLEMSPTKPYGLLVSDPRERIVPTVGAPAMVETTVRVAGPGSPSVAPPASPPALEYWLLRLDGSTRRISVDEGMNWEGWSPDGSLPMFSRIQRVPNSRPIVTLFQVDLATGKLEKAPPTADRREEKSRPEIYASLSPANLTGSGGDVRVRSGWLMGSADRTKTMIAADCSLLSVSPAVNAVAYISNGVALVRPVLQLPKKAFMTALAEVLKQQAMSNAKQTGLATLMYSADYDDQLPLKGMTLSDLLGPYAKSQDVFDGFTMTYGGTSLTDIKDPAHTELGYTSGPGGRAVLYADGHVVWVPDK